MIDEGSRAQRKQGAARVLVLLVVLIAALFLPAHAQPVLSFEHLTLDDGLSDPVSLSLERDSNGFLWVGTQQGLNRYSGARTRVYGREQSASVGSGNYIQALEEDTHARGNVWVGTGSSGLARISPGSEHLAFVGSSRVLPEQHPLPVGDVRTLHSDPQGILWIGTFGGGLVRYDSQTGNYEAFRRRVEDAGSIASDSVRALARSAAHPGTLWVGTIGGLSVFDPTSRQFRTFRHRPGDPYTLSHNDVTAIAEVDSVVWCGTQDGVLHKYDPERQRFIRFNLPSEQTNIAISVLEPSRVYPNILWVGTRGQGIFAFDTESGSATPYAHEAGDPTTLAGNEVLAIEEDEDHVLWVGTLTGLSKARLRARRLPGLQSRWPETEELAQLPVSAIYEAPSDSHVVWLGTIREGLVRFDKGTGLYRRYFDRLDHPLNIIFVIHEDRHGHFWLAGVDDAVYQMNRETGDLQKYAIRAAPPNIWIKQIYEAPSKPDVLWIATRGRGLLQIHAEDSSSVVPYPGVLSSNDVWAVHEAMHTPGVLWVATHGGGLNRIPLLQEELELADDGTGQRVFNSANSCLPSDHIVSIASGQDGVLWLGTFADGLVRFDVRSHTCKSYTEQDGLAHSDVGAILVDDSQRLWLSTSDGLSLFDPEREVFTTFTEEDGLSNNRLFYLARHQTERGQIYIGSQTGFNVFHPDSIAVNVEGPPLRLTALKVDETPYPLGELSEDEVRLILPYNRNDLSFEFAALDLRQPDQNRYKVRLQDAASWTDLGTEASARFYSLSPGAYTFQVIGSNSDGYWNRAAISVPFRIRPPFWKAWWFWFLIALAGIVIAAMAYQYRVQQLLRVERTRQRIADDLHDDIGSKISSVALRLDMVGRSPRLTDGQRSQLSELSRSARGVVDELRDAVWIVDAEYDSLPALAARMEQFAAQLLGQRLCAFERPGQLPAMTVPMEKRRHIYLFYKEALHNAARHSRAGRITVRLRLDGRHLTICVEDDGIGFDANQPSSGRGLKTLRRRAQAMNGRASIESAEGKGTSVCLRVELG